MAFSNLCMGNFGCYCYSLSREHELIKTPKLSLFRHSKNSTQWQCLIARTRITWRLSNEEINKRFRNLKYVIVQKRCLTRPRKYHFLRCACPWGGGEVLHRKRLIGLFRWIGRIFTTGLTIMGLHFSIQLSEWGRRSFGI